MEHYLDRYAYLDSPVHRWEPRFKLLGLGALMFAFAAVQTIYLLPVMLTVALGLYAIAQLPWSFLLKRLRYPSLFILGVIFLLPFVAGETILWQWGGVAIRAEGVTAFVLVLGRFWSILTLGLILLGTSPFLTTVKAMRSLGFPGILADMLLLAYRYLQDLSSTLTTMQRAMRLRGFGYRPKGNAQGRGRMRDLCLLASLAGSLLIRSYDRSQTIYQAMRLRGYGHSLSPAMGLATSTTKSSAPFPWWSFLSLLGAGLTAVSLLSANFWVI